MNYRNPFLALCSILGLPAIAPGEIVISQYYEGSSFNKWVELANTSDAAMSLDDMFTPREETYWDYGAVSNKLQHLCMTSNLL